MKKKLLLLTAALTLSATALATQANYKDSEHAINYRQSAFSMMAYNFGNIADMLKGKQPYDADAVIVRANNVAALAKMPLEGFIDGSDKGDTEALAKAWQDKSDFQEQFKTLIVNVDALAVAAQTKDKNKVKKAFGAVGKSCKSCHDTYKKD